MKKNLVKRLLALVLMVCIFVPQTAFAVTRNYLEVTIEESGRAKYSVTGTSGYLNLSESLTAELVTVINANYDKTDSSTKLWNFNSSAMKAVLDAGLEAYGNGKTEWNTWVETGYKNNSDIKNSNSAADALDLKAKLVDLDTKVSALSVNTPYQLSYKPSSVPAGDAAYGNTYTVTITLKSDTIGDNDDSGSTPTTYPVKTGDIGSQGSVSTNYTSASAGQTVTITVKQDDGYMPSRVTVLDKDGNQVKLTYKGNGVYTFTMPKSAVTINASFRAELVSPETSGTSKLLNSDDHIAFMSGYPDGSFQPNASVSRAEVAQIFYNLLRDQNVTITASFSDVAENAWYAKAVNTLASLGVISGVGGQKFEPDRAITRAEFTAIAAKFANAAGGSVSFTDVPTTHWAYQSIATAASYGWVSGVGDNQFAPDRSITRAEAATIVNHMLGRLGDQDKIDAGAGVSFSDVSQSHWAWYEIAEATTAHSYSLDSGRTVETWK